MSELTMRMSPHLQSTTTLATQVVDPQVPEWAASAASIRGAAANFVQLGGNRTERDVFRLPNSNPVFSNWLYTRPTVEALDEDSFANCAIESTTIFRIENFDLTTASVEIAPTVSHHWLLVPVQTVNGVTVGITYMDVLYQREHDTQNCVPPLRVGKFAVEQASGEVFITGWHHDLMTVGWAQSIIKCERVSELLMYQAPPVNGVKPTKLLLRNSFYKRRDCRLCGVGTSLNSLQPPCSDIHNSPDAHDLGPRHLRESDGRRSPMNVASLYRRFRGGYFGVCLKTAFTLDGAVSGKTMVPVFVDIKHGLHSVKQGFRHSLQQNCDFTLNGLFGLHPSSSSRVFFLRTSAPVTSMLQICDTDYKKRKASFEAMEDDRGRLMYEDMRRSAVCMEECDTSTITSDRSASPPARRRRRVGIDEVDRGSIEFERKRRNRIAAERSNRLRRERLAREKRELEELKRRKEFLENEHNSLIAQNRILRQQLGIDLVP